METETATAIVLVEQLTPMQLFAPGAMRPLLDRIKAEVRAIDTDISTETGRKAVASLAYKVARTKTFIDEQRVKLVADEKKRLAAIDAEGKKVREELDELKEEVRKPLTDWENAEQDRIRDHESRIAGMAAYEGSPYSSVDQLNAALLRIDSLWDHNFQEFTKRATLARERAVLYLETAKKNILQLEAEQAERERLEAKEKEKNRIARETKIAEDARLAAEAKAKREADAEAARVLEREALVKQQAEAEKKRIEDEAAAERDRLQKEKLDVERKAQKASDDARAAAQRAKLAAEERERKVKADRIAAEKKAEADRVAAVEAERKRLEDIQKAKDEIIARAEANRKQRAADQKHRAEIAGAAVNALVAHGIDATSAVCMIGLIDAGEVPNVTISY